MTRHVISCDLLLIDTSFAESFCCNLIVKIFVCFLHLNINQLKKVKALKVFFFLSHKISVKFRFIFQTHFCTFELNNPKA